MLTNLDLFGNDIPEDDASLKLIEKKCESNATEDETDEKVQTQLLQGDVAHLGHSVGASGDSTESFPDLI